MAKDPDWDGLAGELARTAGRGGKRGAELLRQRVPRLHAEIACLRESDWPIACWGQSHNFDEIVQQRIVEPQVLRTIGNVAGVTLPSSSCHSGLLHTYGYLLSVIDTPYGKKRDRWLRPTLAQGFGFGARVLRVMPDQGTLLHNVTWLLARIAFRDDPKWLRRLRKSCGHVSDLVVDYSYRKLKITRIQESVRLADRRLVELCTELVPFPCKRSKANHALLIYWCRTTRTGKRLLTAFPVSQAWMAERVALARQPNVAARVRFNGQIDGFATERPARSSTSTGTG
tara:strand:- start:7555 stop:8409 length:855 start_codon:yes stop_codon:yes gene_type:complete